jgi:hypothetical protein
MLDEERAFVARFEIELKELRDVLLFIDPTFVTGAKSINDSHPFTSKFPAVTIENIIIQKMFKLIASLTLQEVRYMANMFISRLQPGAIAIRA